MNHIEECRRVWQATVLLLALATSVIAQQRPLVLQPDPASTTAETTLSATLHTVHGKFLLRHGEVRFDPATGKISGEIVFDATSGKTGNEGRDRKMHKDVLESSKFP
ncbi:MAG TPA: YceI family protein, partial [Terriglobales bacterium]|nr:YceI family protein [Terriglobales bacterium]